MSSRDSRRGASFRDVPPHLRPNSTLYTRAHHLQANPRGLHGLRQSSHHTQWRIPLLLILFNLTILATCVGILVSHNYFLPYSTIRAAKEVTFNPEDPIAAYFGNVVLVINVNYEAVAHDTAKFWRRFYGRFFRTIVVICRTEIPDIGVERASATYPQAYGIWEGTEWGYHYAALPRLMNKYKDAEGLLWTNDDVIINYWNLLKANKSKLWLPNDPEKPEYMYFGFYPTDNETYPVFEDWANETIYMMQAWQALKSFPLTYQLQYSDSTNNTQVYHKRVCDLFYIPRRHFSALANDLFPAVLEAQMMSEMGIPMSFLALENPSQWDHVLDDMVYNWELLWGTNISYDPRDHWSPNISAFHPFKVASLRGKISLLETTKTGDPSVRSLFPYFLPTSIFQKLHDHVIFLVKEMFGIYGRL